jgi:hypothetical protein
MPQGFERPAASPRPDGHHGGTVQGELGHDHYRLPPVSADALRTDKKGD